MLYIQTHIMTNGVSSLIKKRELSGKSYEKSLLQQLYISPVRELKFQFCEKSDRKAFYDGNLYLSNFSRCFTGCYINNKPHFIKTKIQKSTSKMRFVDFLRRHCSLYGKDSESGNLNIHFYQEILYLLALPSTLVSYSMNNYTFNILNQICLGSRFGFLHLNWDKINDRFYAQSKHHSVNEKCNAHFYFAIFDSAPFKFVGIFEITENIFGKVLDASLSDGILYVSLKNMVILYDLENILDEFKVQNINIGDTLQESSISKFYDCITSNPIIVGSLPYGLPINIHIKHTPKILKKIPCSNFSSLSFGGFPWAYLIFDKNQVKVFRLEDGKLGAVFENDDTKSGSLDEKPAYFHVDNSGHILHIQSESINFYKIIEEAEFKLKTNLVIQVANTKNKTSLPHISKFGRVLKRSYNSGCIPLQSEVIHALDYCHDTNVLAVLYTKIEEFASDRYVIGLFDNSTAMLMKEYPINEHAVSDDNEWVLFLNGLSIVCLLTSIISRLSKCYIFQLQQNMV